MRGWLRVVTRENAYRIAAEVQAGDEEGCSALVATTKHIGICPVPLIGDPVLRQLFGWEQTMETYGLPLVQGGIADQPRWFLDACAIIRGVRNKYQNSRTPKPTKDKT